MNEPIAKSAEIELTPVAPPAAKPRVWTVFLALAATLVLQVVFGGVIVVLAMVLSGNVRESAEQLTENLATPEMFMLLVGSAELAFGLAAIGAAWLSPVPLRRRLGLVPAQPSWRVYPLTMLGSWAPLALGIGMAYALTLVLPADNGVETLFENITLAHAVPFVLFIALPPGIFEELMFRGYMQRRFVERWKPGWAILLTSLLFALVHVQPHTVAAVFPLGVWFGVVALRTGSVFPCMLGHAFVNGSLNAWRMVVKFAEIPETTQIVVMVASVIVGGVCFVLAVNRLIGADDAMTESRRRTTTM